MPVKCLSIAPVPSETVWSSVGEYSPENDDEQPLGKLFISITVNGKDDLAMSGKHLLSSFRDSYYLSEDTPFESLKNSIKELIDEANGLGLAVNTAAASLVDENIYLVTTGGRVALKRDGVFTNILSSGEEILSGSGKLKDKDIVVLGTEDFFLIASDRLSKDDIVALELGEMVEEVSPLIHVNESPGSSAMFFEYTKTVSDELPEYKARRDVSSEKKSILGFVKKKKIFVDRPETLEDKKSKKMAISVGLILIVLLVVSIIFGAKRKNEKDYQEQYASRLSQAQHSYEEAISLYEVSPERSREHFWESKGIVDSLIEDGFEEETILELEKKLFEVEGKILGEYKVEISEFLDLSLLSDGFSGTDLASNQKSLAILDSSSEKAILTTFDAKDTQVVAGPGAIDDAKNVAVYSDRVFVQMGDGIYEVDESAKKSINRVWEGDALINAYTGNMYVVDTKDSDIIRFSGVGAGFATGRSWLREGSEPDLSKIKSMAIDGSIWLLNTEGDIFKFSLGNQVNFSVTGIAPELDQPSQIFTSDEVDGIYLLDDKNSRVVVIDKEGTFLAQYSDSKISEATDLVVSEDEGKGILLVGDKLMSFEINHVE